MEKIMGYQTLQGTDLTISNVILGTRDYGWNVPEDQADTLLTAYYDMGGTNLDTAHIYGRTCPGDRSISELTIGRWLKRHGIRRDTIFLSSKGCSNVPGIRSYKRVTPEYLREDFEESLVNLGTDYLDFYFLHKDDESKPVEPMIDALNALVKAGKLRAFGASNWTVERLDQAQRYARESGQLGFAAVQLLYNMAFPNLSLIDKATDVAITDRTLRYLVKNQIPYFAYSALARGYFHMWNKPEFRIDSRRARAVEFYDNSESRLRAQRAEQLCRETGMSMSEVVLGFVMSRGVQGVPIVEPGTVNHFEDTFRAANARLTQEQIDFILYS